MMRNLFWVLVLLAPLPVFSAENRNVVDEMVDTEHQRTWNRFASRVHDLHLAQLSRHTVRMEKRFGEYGGATGKGHFFRETSFFDADSGRLLSRVRSNRARPEELQSVDVYVYDAHGQLLRDYSFTFLPWGRAAPLQTLIRLHHYPDELHAWRQFDASGITLYEFCEGMIDDRPVRIAIWEDELGKPVEEAEAYRRCFAGLPNSAGPYLHPQ